MRSRTHWIQAGKPDIDFQQQLTQALPPVDTGDTTTPDMDEDHTDGEDGEDGEDYEMAADDADDYDSYQDHHPVWENAASGAEFEGDELEVMEAGSESENENESYSQEEENSTAVLDQRTISNIDFFSGSHFTPINAPARPFLRLPAAL